MWECYVLVVTLGELNIQLALFANSRGSSDWFVEAVHKFGWRVESVSKARIKNVKICN